MAEYSVINRRVPRLDTPQKARGRAQYVDDMTMPGMLHGVLVQSGIAHGRILNIDTRKAKALPGVKAVITAKETGEVLYGVSPARYDETLFAGDKVRYVGDEVAAVAAEDLDTAMEAASLIKVEYEELPAVLQIVEEALAEGAPAIHDKFPNNIAVEVHQEFGDVAKALEECAWSAPTPSAQQAPGRRLHRAPRGPPSRSSTHHRQPDPVQLHPGAPLRAAHRGHGHRPAGGQGAGDQALCGRRLRAQGRMPPPWTSAPPCFRMKTGRPVKMVYTREQVFLHSRARHQFIHLMKTGFKADGTIYALEHDNAVWRAGPTPASASPRCITRDRFWAGPTSIPNMKYDGYRVYTNKPACGAQRGHGGVASPGPALSSSLDMCARELKMDPADLRLKNIMEAGDVTCNELNMSPLGMKESIEAVQGLQLERNARRQAAPGQGHRHGLRVLRVRGGVSHLPLRDLSLGGGNARCRRTAAPCACLTGSAEIGQGSDTTLAMMARRGPGH